MKKIIVFLLMTAMIVVLVGCNKVEVINEKILDILATEKITQQQLDEIFSLYDALNDKEKVNVKDFNKIEKYRGVDIEKVNKINADIAGITSNSSFPSLLEIQEDIERLSSKERDLINQAKLDESLKLTDLEKAAVAACQTIKKCLKNESSFELLSAEGIDDLNGTSHFYLVLIEYSATNSFGGRTDETSFQTIDTSFQNPWLPLAMLLGNTNEALECSAYVTHYFTHDSDPIEFDCEKILYYIDEDLVDK